MCMRNGVADGNLYVEEEKVEQDSLLPECTYLGRGCRKQSQVETPDDGRVCRDR